MKKNVLNLQGNIFVCKVLFLKETWTWQGDQLLIKFFFLKSVFGVYDFWSMLRCVAIIADCICLVFVFFNRLFYFLKFLFIWWRRWPYNIRFIVWLSWDIWCIHRIVLDWNAYITINVCILYEKDPVIIYLYNF